MLTFYPSKFKNCVLFDKMAKHNEANLHSHAISVRGATHNQYGRLYIHGCAMGAERIAEVVECYQILREQTDDGRVPVSHVAQMANVSWDVTKRVILEVDASIGDSRPGWLTNRTMGVASKVVLTYEHECFILWIRFMDPFDSNYGYVREFHSKYGIKLLKMFFTCWFWDHFEKSGRLVVEVLVPIDKLKFKNVVRYGDYCGFVQGIASESLVFFY